jgi:hypothetical protein
MQGIQSSYTQSYNRRHKKVGHLFQGRYKAILCDRDAYLLELVRYIHINPARLKVPHNPWRYRWSSHGAYLGKPSAVKVDTQEVFSQFSARQGSARRRYQGFMEEGIGQGHQGKYYATIDLRFLGDEPFVSQVAERSEAKEVELRGKKVGFTRLLQAVSGTHGVESGLLLRPGRQRRWVAVRAQLVYLARQWCGLTTKELGRRLNRDASMISRLCAWYQGHRDQQTEEKLASLLSK